MSFQVGNPSVSRILENLFRSVRKAEAPPEAEPGSSLDRHMIDGEYKSAQPKPHTFVLAVESR
jgi:hypothetical protein